MDIHKKARTTPLSRMLMVKRLAEGLPIAAVAAAQGVTPKTVRKWRDRHAAEGAAGLADSGSKPHDSPTPLASAVEDEIEQLCRQGLSGPAIARRLRRPVSTVGVALRRGLGRLSALDPRPSRYTPLRKSRDPRRTKLRYRHGRFSGHGRPAAWIAADVVRFEDGKLAEHWGVLQDEATEAESVIGLAMFGHRFPA